MAKATCNTYVQYNGGFATELSLSLFYCEFELVITMIEQIYQVILVMIIFSIIFATNS